MAPLRILADENIPLVDEAFSPFGEVTTMAGRQMTAADVADKDVLLVRSVTRVDAGLLDSSRVQFVGTATIGTDHIDLAWLEERGVSFASAPACNADSVADYIMAALLELAPVVGRPLVGSTLGIVGVGNIGARLARRAAALGMEVLLNDPPRARVEGAEGFVDLAEVQRSSDFVTFHVPGIKDGPDRTVHLADGAFLDGLRPGAVVLNTARGAVVDNVALKARLGGGELFAVLDVWEGEPAIDVELLADVVIGTPHIAGYAYDGKIRGTMMLHHALAAHLGATPTFDPESLMPPVEPARVDADGALPLEEALREVCRAVWDIRSDDARLRAIAEAPPAERAELFDRLRKTYPIRRELAHFVVTCPPTARDLASALQAVGFTVDMPPAVAGQRVPSPT